MLSFVKHALQSAKPLQPADDKSKRQTPLKDILRFIPDQPEVSSEDEGDSDDDTPGSDTFTADDEMTETSINLLLSILEGIYFSRLFEIASHRYSQRGPIARHHARA